MFLVLYVVIKGEGNNSSGTYILFSSISNEQALWWTKNMGLSSKPNFFYFRFQNICKRKKAQNYYFSKFSFSSRQMLSVFWSVSISALF